MNLEHFYVYLYGGLRREHVPLDQVMQIIADTREDYVVMLRHAHQRDELGGLGLMYGVAVKTETWDNWQAKVALAKMERSSFTVAPPKRLPNLVISNYRLPNIMGI